MLPTHRMQERCHFSEITAEESAACDWHVNCLGRQAGRQASPTSKANFRSGGQVPVKFPFAGRVARRHGFIAPVSPFSTSRTHLLLPFLSFCGRARRKSSRFSLSAVEQGVLAPFSPFPRSSTEKMLPYLGSCGRKGTYCSRFNVTAVEST